MKKIFAVAIVCAMIIPVFITGCAKEEKEDGPITLTMWTHEDPNRQKMEEAWAAEYMAKNPNVTIKYSVYPSSKIQDVITTSYAAKNAPAIWNMQLEKAYPLLEQGLVAAVDPEAIGKKNSKEVIDMYMDGMLDPVTDEDGNVYGMPLELNNWCIYLNKNIFRDAGLDPDKDYPKTWEEVMEVSEKIVLRDGDIITRRGFDFRYPDYLISWVPMVQQLGGAVVSEDGKEAIVGKDAWVKVLAYMQEFGPNEKNLGSPTYTKARKQFDNDNNEIAMSFSGLYQEARMKKANSEFFNSDDWMVIPYPVFKGGRDLAGAYYFQYYMVNSQLSKREQREAWKFVDFLLSHPEDYLRNVALIQPRTELVESELFKSMPYSDVFMDDVTRGECVYYGASSLQINKLITEAIENVMMSNVSPEDAYAKLKRDAQDLIDNAL